MFFFNSFFSCLVLKKKKRIAARSVWSCKLLRSESHRKLPASLFKQMIHISFTTVPPEPTPLPKSTKLQHSFYNPTGFRRLFLATNSTPGDRSQRTGAPCPEIGAYIGGPPTRVWNNWQKKNRLSVSSLADKISIRHVLLCEPRLQPTYAINEWPIRNQTATTHTPQPYRADNGPIKSFPELAGRRAFSWVPHCSV